MVRSLACAAFATALTVFGPLTALAQEPAPVPAPAPDAAAPAAPAEGEDRLVATVNGEEIRESDVMAAIAMLPAQYRQLPPQLLFPSMTDQLVTGVLIAGRAYSEGLNEDQEVKDRVAQSERRIVQDVWMQRQIDAQISEDAINQAYQDYLATNPPAEEVQARHILVATQEEAQAIIEELGGGADFATLAQERSIDTASGAQGGDLGYFVRERMVPQFADAAFALQPGETSPEPVQSDFGWHVIRVEDRRLTAPPAPEEIRPDLEEQVTRGVIDTIVAELRTGAEVVMFGPDGQPLPDEPPAEAPAEGAAPVVPPAEGAAPVVPAPAPAAPTP